MDDDRFTNDGQNNLPADLQFSDRAEDQYPAFTRGPEFYRAFPDAAIAIDAQDSASFIRQLDSTSASARRLRFEGRPSGGHRARLAGQAERYEIHDAAFGPWSAICYLNIRLSAGQRIRGTGWLVSQDTVVTAAHNVLSAEGYRARGPLEVYPGRTRDSNESKYTLAREVAVHPAWATRGSRAFDIGAIKLENANLVGPDDRLQYGVYTDVQLSNAALVVNLAGYPDDVGAPDSLIADVGHIFGFDNHYLLHRFDTYFGHSGGPLFVGVSGSLPLAAGLHSGIGRNGIGYAIRINEEIFNKIENWKNFENMPDAFRP